MAPGGAIEHPTGATDVILRYEQGGGFVMPTYLASQTPIFTLYGDGTVIFRDPSVEAPAQVGNVFRMAPLRVAQLDERQIQTTLKRAIVDGGLAIARRDYGNDQVADASTATFTVNAGGFRKSVSVYALGLEIDGMPDLQPRKAFESLAEDLAGFGRDGTIATEVYEPAAYRGILLDGNGAETDAVAWPWNEIAPTDFVSPDDPNAFQLPQRIMSADEIDALTIDDHQGGWQGLTLRGPDGTVYSFTLRPLLPDDLTQPASA